MPPKKKWESKGKQNQLKRLDISKSHNTLLSIPIGSYSMHDITHRCSFFFGLYMCATCKMENREIKSLAFFFFFFLKRKRKGIRKTSKPSECTNSMCEVRAYFEHISTLQHCIFTQNREFHILIIPITDIINA